MKTMIALFTLTLTSFAAEDIRVSGQIPSGYSLVKVYTNMMSQKESMRCATYEVAGLGVMVTGVKWKEVKGKVSFQDQNNFTAQISGKKIQSFRDSFCEYQGGTKAFADFISKDGKVITTEL